MTDTERRQLATSALASELPTYGYLNPAFTQLTYADQAGVMTVGVAYDASSSPLWALNGVIPMPSSTIARNAGGAGRRILRWRPGSPVSSRTQAAPRRCSWRYA